MVTNITFCEVEDLEKVTGLTHNELWKNGFNLDDCDGILILDEKDLPLEKVEAYRYMDEVIVYRWQPKDDLFIMYCDKIISYPLYQILNDWENYCVGCRYVNYNGKVYVSKHHA